MMTREFYADAKEWLDNARSIAADYAADVDAWYRSGDGRSTREGGRGYAYPYCRHGASLWVDHDIPCGRCEDGDDDNLYAGALAYAHRKARERTERSDHVMAGLSGLSDVLAALAAMGATVGERNDVHKTVTTALAKAYKA